MSLSINLNHFDYNKSTKRISIASEMFGMPSEFEIVSNYTGKVVKFIPVQMGDPLYDEDGWDGEQKIYRPVDYLKNVEYAVIYNQY